MKLWYFSETCYPYLPEESSFDSIRVTLGNGNMDPRKAADLWHRYLDEWQAAEAFNFGLMVNEHHSTATCMDPAGPIVAGILARITTTAPILILGNPIANRRDPVRVAEEMALVDVISRGRLTVGLVRGVPYEISATNSYPIRMTDRFWEAHDLIIKAWTTIDGPFSWTGEFFEHRQVNIWPRPFQQPHPPVWVTTLNPASAVRIADHGYTLATFLLGVKGTQPIFEAYRDRRAAQGREFNHDQLAYCALVHVADSEEAARIGGEQLMWYAKANKVTAPFHSPVGYMPPQARLKVFAADTSDDSSSLKNKSMAQMIDEGIMFCGTPDTVFEQIERFHSAVGGFGQLLMMGQAGFLDGERTLKSMRLFSEEVAPRLAALDARAAL